MNSRFDIIRLANASHRQEIAMLISTVVSILNNATVDPKLEGMYCETFKHGLSPDEVWGCARKALAVYMNYRIK